MKFEKNMWVTWEVHTRSRSITGVLNIPLIELTSNRHRVIKYFGLCAQTIKCVVKNKPKVIIAQNPSIVLGYLMLMLRTFFKFRLILDCHNAGLFPLEGKYKGLNKLAHFLVSKADYSIVTNSELAKIVQNIGGRPIILNDPIPNFNYEKLEKNGEKKVTLISTWADDEPVAEFINAASAFPNIEFTITGRAQSTLINVATDNVRFPGFVSREEYIKLIANSDLIVDLTHRENCLVCGAYEAVAVEVPILLSNTVSLQSTFDKGATFCENTVEGIKNGLDAAVKQLSSLQEDIVEMKDIHTERWNKASETLKGLL